MTRFWPEGDPIDMVLDGQGSPLRFTWQGRSHRLQQVQQRWQIDTDWWSEEGRIWRDYLAVTTADGLLCVIYYDFLQEGWYVGKVYD